MGVFLLEFNDGLLEDLLAGETEQVRTVELELGWAVQAPINQFLGITEHFFSQICLILNHDAVLRIPQIKSDSHRQGE